MANSLSIYGITGHEHSASSHGITARIDNAQTTDQSARNWWAADYLSARASNSFQVRRTLRMRSRYETCSNPRLWGVCTNYAADLIDTGPTLQCHFQEKRINDQIEMLWRDWCAEVGWVEKLTTSTIAEVVDGEGPLLLKHVSDMEHPVKIFPVDIEADQVTNSFGGMASLKMEEWMTDGVEIHRETGQAKSYSILKYHPGDYFTGGPMESERVPARNVIFPFHKFRPGQIRGLPVFTPSLDLFTEVRSFRKSTLEAAQTAANHSAVIESDAPAGMDDDDSDAENYEFRRVGITRNMQTVLPVGWRMHQFDAKHPNTTYRDFSTFSIAEAIRPLAYPLYLALGNSADFNFSSAKIDHINYHRVLRITRETRKNAIVIEPMFRAFIYEAARAGLLPEGIRSARDIPHGWHWPEFESIDPLVDAQADQLRLAGGQDTWQDFWARRGKDHIDQFNKLSEAQKLLFKLDVKIGEPVKQPVTNNESDGPQTKAEFNRMMQSARDRAERARQEYESLASGEI